MITNKLKKTFLIVLFVLLLCISFGLLSVNGNYAKADADTNAFRFETGTYVKISGNGGMRFRLQIGETKKNEIMAATDTDLVFYVGPKAYIDGYNALSNTYNDMVSANHAWTVTADKNLIYAGRDDNGQLDGYYYSNVLLNINTLAERYRDIDFVAVAVFGDTIVKSVDRTLYYTVNKAAVNGYFGNVMATYSWLGETSSYKIIATGATGEYENLVAGIANAKTKFFYLDHVADTNNLLTDPSYVNGSITQNAITFEMGELSAISPISIDYGANISATLAGVSVKTKDGLKFLNWQLKTGESAYAELSGSETATQSITVKAVYAENNIPDYFNYSNDKSLDIWGFWSPILKEDQYKLLAESGIDTIIINTNKDNCNYNKTELIYALEMCEQYGLKAYLSNDREDQQSFRHYCLDFLYKPTEDTSVDANKTYYLCNESGNPTHRYTVVANPVQSDLGLYYETAYPAFVGIDTDEPYWDQFDALAAAAEEFYTSFPDKVFCVNLMGLSGKTFTQVMQHYIDLFDPAAHGSGLSFDQYFITSSGISATAFSKYIDKIADMARDNDIPFQAYILTVPYRNSHEFEITEKTIGLECYTYMAFGAKTLKAFTYSSPGIPPYDGEFDEDDEAMIGYQNQVTPIYYAAQNVFNKIHSWDHIFLNYEWQGVYTVGSSSVFSGITESKLNSYGNLGVRSTSYNTLIGCFRDTKKGLNGYMVTNFDDPFLNRNNTVTLNFADSNYVLVCHGNDIYVTGLNANHDITLTLSTGDAAFVVPYSIPSENHNIYVSGGSANKACTYFGDIVTLTVDNSMILEGQEFKCWEINGVEYYSDTVMMPDSDIDVIAVYEVAEITNLPVGATLITDYTIKTQTFLQNWGGYNLIEKKLSEYRGRANVYALGASTSGNCWNSFTIRNFNLMSDSQFAAAQNDLTNKAMFFDVYLTENVISLEFGFGGHAGNKVGVDLSNVPRNEWTTVFISMNSIASEMGGALYAMLGTNVAGYQCYIDRIYVGYLEQYAITVTGGTASVNNARYGDTVTLTVNNNAIPEGKSFGYWTVNGEQIVGNTFVMPNQAVTVIAVYSPELAIPEGALLVTDYSTSPSPWNNPNYGHGTVGVVNYYAESQGRAGVVAFGTNQGARSYTQWTAVVPSFDGTGYNKMVLRVKIDTSKCVRAVFDDNDGASLITAATSNQWGEVELNLSDVGTCYLTIATDSAGDCIWIDQIYLIALPTYAISVTGGTANTDNAGYGETVTLTVDNNAIPEGQSFVYWTVNGEQIVGNTFVMPNQAVTVIAVYSPELAIPEGALLVTDYSSSPSPWNNPNYGHGTVGVVNYYAESQGRAGVVAFGTNQGARSYTQWTAVVPSFDGTGYNKMVLRVKIDTSKCVRAVFDDNDGASLITAATSNQWGEVELNLSDVGSCYLTIATDSAGDCIWIDQIYVKYVAPTATLYDATQITSVWGGTPGNYSDWVTMGATPDGNAYTHSWGQVGTTYVGAKFNLKLGANTSWLFISFGASTHKNASISSGQSGVMLCISAESHKGLLINTSAGFGGITTGYDFSAGGEYLIEVGVLEAGHYYFKVNGVLVQEVTGMETSLPGSYLNITSWDANTQIKTALS